MKVRQLSDSQGLSYLHLVMLSLYAILLGVLVGLIDAIFGRVLIYQICGARRSSWHGIWP